MPVIMKLSSIISTNLGISKISRAVGAKAASMEMHYLPVPIVLGLGSSRRIAYDRHFGSFKKDTDLDHLGITRFSIYHY